MSKSTRWLLSASLVAGLSIFSAVPAWGQQQNPAAEMAAVEDLKSKAFSSLRLGEFDKTSQLLDEAAKLSNEPSLRKMTQWLAEYRTKQQFVLEERQKDFDESLERIKKLTDRNLVKYSAGELEFAFIHSVDKKKFIVEPWVTQLLDRVIEAASNAEKTGNLLQARSLYGNLSAIEPTSSKWRNKVSEVSRQISMLATYTPDLVEEQFRTEATDRRAVALILDPDKAPATQPTEEAVQSAFKIDWKEMLQGIRLDMLVEAIRNAKDNYYRETSYTELVSGGVDGLQLLLNTKGLERTFPGLGDADARHQFLQTLSDIRLLANDSNDLRMFSQSLRALLESNRRSLKLPDEVLIYEFANGAFNKLDQFSAVIWPTDLAEFVKSMQGEFIGVGIQIREEDGWLTVTSPMPDTPAYRGGVHADDVITHIDGKSARGLTSSQAVKVITGPANTTVTLTVRSPDGKVKDLPLKRELIKVASVKGWSQTSAGSWDWFVDSENRIGYVRISTFSKDTSKELSSALEQVQKQNAKAVILDLRHNPGGLLTSATEVSDKFLGEGLIVSTRTAQDVPTSPPAEARSTPDDVDLPMIVLVNQCSASASEIVSGALKDHNRALVVGERTFGKGSVQMIFPLANGSARMRLTMSHYFLPSGRCIHHEDDSAEWGVDPDLTIDMTPEQMAMVNRLRQRMDVVRNGPATRPIDLPAEFQTPEQQLLSNDPQLSTALLLLRMKIAGAPLM